MTPYPLLFEPILVEKVWGGRRLEALGKPLPPDVSIGESWELADLPDSSPNGRSVIANGSLTGMTLREAMASHDEQIVGSAALSDDGGFPLLIKYLDARENLSIQVHPDEAYVAAHPETHLKSEAWYVVEADPAAVIFRGVKPGLNAAIFAEHIESGEVPVDLRAISARTGDCHYLPSGTCHALGAGTLVAEVQTPSDTTFRVYDWGRTTRQLHIEQALACIDFDHPPPPSQPGPLRRTESGQTQRLVATSFFAIDRIEVEAGKGLPVVPAGMPEVWMNLAGEAEIQTGGGPSVDLKAGTTVLLPAAMKASCARYRTRGTLLRITLPAKDQTT